MKIKATNRPMKTTFPYYLDKGTEEVECEVVCLVTPGYAGQTYGPPERCYPPEPADVEVMHVTMGEIEYSYEEFEQLVKSVEKHDEKWDLYDWIYEKAVERAGEISEDLLSIEMDARVDARRDAKMEKEWEGSNG